MKCMISVKPTERQEERRQKRNIRANDAHFNAIGRLTAIALRNSEGFGAKRFQIFDRASYDLGRDYIAHYSTDDKSDLEYAVYSYYALRRDLRAIGFDPEVEFWADDVYEGLSTPVVGHLTRSQREKRESLIGYASSIGFYSRQMLCMNALALHRQWGYGAGRLRRDLCPVSEAYIALLRLYVRDDMEGFRRGLYQIRDEFNAMGIFKAEVII